MTCKPFSLPSGGSGFICDRTRRPHPNCSVCGGRASKLCDFPKDKGTCDLPLCRRCGIEGGEDTDYCPNHDLSEIWGALL